MSKQIEIQINRFLSQFGDLDYSADQILKAIERQSLGRPDVYSVASFLYHSGFNRALLSFVLKCIDKERAIPWHFLAELTKNLNAPDPRFIKTIVVGADSSADSDVLAQSTALDENEPKLVAIRKHQRTLEQSNYQKEKSNLLDQIRVFREQNKLDLELDLILKLQRSFPRDPEVAIQYNIYLERKARNYLNKRKSELPLIFREDINLNSTSIDVLYAQAQDIISKDKSQALDLAMLFHFMDENETAVKVAQMAIESESRNWLIAELLILAEKYPEALDWLLLLETQYVQNTETPFSVSYLRSLCYYGLGQKETAVAVLEGLIHVRPNYRLAETLYKSWSDEIA